MAVAPRWNRLDYDERRAQILSAARNLFGERHYSAVSAAEIARAAGVTRGLLNHYFGTKRDLYLEVVRAMVRLPDEPVPPARPGRPIEAVVAESVDLWLDLADRHHGTWFASVHAEGFGRDPEVESIVNDARAAMVELIIVTLGLAGTTHPDELRAVLRTYSGLAELASREWLVDRTLSRAQTHALLCSALLALVREVAPVVAAAR